MSATQPIEVGGRISVTLDEIDGDPCHRFSKDGPVELWLTAYEQPADADGARDRKMLVVPLTLPNYPTARKHAERLGILTGALEAAIREAQADADAAIPAPDDGHRHVVRFARYRRSLPFSAECELCMATLVEDVKAWAAARGIPVPLHDALVGGSTLRETIEAVVNQDG